MGGGFNLKYPDVRATLHGNKQQGEDVEPIYNPVGWHEAAGVEFHFLALKQGEWSREEGMIVFLP